MSEHQRSIRVNVVLDDEHAAKLHGLLDQADPDSASVTALLDAIPGAFGRGQQGLADVRADRLVPLDEL